MRSIHSLLAGFIVAAAVTPAGAQGVGRFVDAAHFPIDRANLVMALGGSSHQRLAQTLTVEVGGTLAGIFMPIACGAGKVQVEIHDVAGGVPGPTVLAHRTVSPAQFDVAGRFIFVPVGAGLALTAGQQISFVVEDKQGSCLYYPSPVGSDYTGGNGFFEALPNPPGWVAFNSFANTFDDLPFQLVLE